MRKLKLLIILAMLASVLALPQVTQASIHEIIGAACRAGGEEVVPPGQNQFDRNSALRALQATGVITSIQVSGDDTTINFDPSTPNSKFISAGFPLTIPNAFGPGADLTLNPLLIPDPEFAAHANCANLNL